MKGINSRVNFSLNCACNLKTDFKQDYFSTYFFGGIRESLCKVFKYVNLHGILGNLLENGTLSLKINFAKLFFQ